MDFKTIFTGGVPIILGLSVILTALVSFFLLWKYRRAVLRAMNIPAGVTLFTQDNGRGESAGKQSNPAEISIVDSFSPPLNLQAGESNFRASMKSLNRMVIVYFFGGLMYAAVLSVAWIIASEATFTPTLIFLLIIYFLWPFILAVNFANPSIRIRIAVFYFVILFLIVIYALVRNSESSFAQLAFLWLFLNASGTLLLLLFMFRKIRAVGPIVLAFLVTALTGSVTVINLVGNNDELMQNIANIGSRLNLGAPLVVLLLIAFGFGLFGILGWQLLQWLGRRYKNKKMSDLSIILDSVWLLFSVVQSLTLVFEGWLWVFTGVAAFILYKLTIKTGFYLSFKKDVNFTKGKQLLLLRVFSLGRQSERLFDRISGIWLRGGSINLIAGPDLVTSTVEPHEFLEFMGGRLGRQFVSGQEDLENRLVEKDDRPDPDGRYRVNEFFCRADTWQMTMQKLAGECDAVLMDLRSFSRINQGCIIELRHLINYVPLGKICIIADESTDRLFLEETIKSIHEQINPLSPNFQKEDGTVRIFRLRNKSKRELKNLMIQLLGISAAA